MNKKKSIVVFLYQNKNRGAIVHKIHWEANEKYTNETFLLTLRATNRTNTRYIFVSSYIELMLTNCLALTASIIATTNNERKRKRQRTSRKGVVRSAFFSHLKLTSLCRVYVSEMTSRKSYSWSTSGLKRVHQSITTAISRYRGPQRNLRPCAVPFRRNRKCNAGPNYCRHQISLGIGHRASSCRSIFSYWFYCSPFDVVDVVDVAIYRLDEPAGGGYVRVMVVSF